MAPSGTVESTAGKIIECRAAVCWEPKKPYSIETIEVAPPKANEVRVKIYATGVCHSDATVSDGHDDLAVFPMIMGHEGAGIVESVGDGVTSVVPGDHVIPLWLPHCGICKPCQNNTNWCNSFMDHNRQATMNDGTTRFSCKGKSIYHFVGTSTFTEFTVMNEANVCKINRNAPMDKICLLGCSVTTGYGSAVNVAMVTPGSSVAIWGLGGIGLAVAMGCRDAGASRIIGVDINKAKFDLAKKFGCTEFINPKDLTEPIDQMLTKETDGGLDFAFECIGNVSTMNAAIDSTHAGWGKTVLIGLSPSDHKLSLSPVKIIMGRTVTGAFFGGWQGKKILPSLVDKYMQKKILLDEFITCTLPLDKINEAFNLMLSGKSIRTVITM